MNINCKINGRDYSLNGVEGITLVDILRNKLGFTGTKEGCGIGECGACTVIIDGLAVNSCMVLGSQIDGKDIITIEGLKENGEYDEIQKLFVKNGAIQCGYCTSGMIMSTKALLNINPDPSDEEIKMALEGNLCRCTGYSKIFKAVKEAGGAK